MAPSKLSLSSNKGAWHFPRKTLWQELIENIRYHIFMFKLVIEWIKVWKSENKINSKICVNMYLNNVYCIFITQVWIGEVK